MVDTETIKAALWVARDLSIRQTGAVPDEVKDAPLALQRLVEENALLRRSLGVLSEDLERERLVEENALLRRSLNALASDLERGS